jgi:enediyne biosynthesis protein E4
VTPQSGAALRQPIVARGAAHADIDLDGDPDLLITTNNGPAKLLRNDRATGSSAGRALRLDLRGTKSNRSAIGARVTLRASDGTRRWQIVKTGSSYLSQSELPLTFGLAPSLTAEAIEIVWPSGFVERLGGEKAGQTLIVEEGRGIIQRSPLGTQ